MRTSLPEISRVSLLGEEPYRLRERRGRAGWRAGAGALAHGIFAESALALGLPISSPNTAWFSQRVQTMTSRRSLVSGNAG